ncbi:hypothetical protein HZ326_14761 [Fusarium oxysporum f. sp. albedinis]|jgi:hypothetical protein|nr:hypothetical protein HZ326_14761 [Fusarium oxysporum f. sp. albedinis]
MLPFAAGGEVTSKRPGEVMPLWACVSPSLSRDNRNTSRLLYFHCHIVLSLHCIALALTLAIVRLPALFYFYQPISTQLVVELTPSESICLGHLFYLHSALLSQVAWTLYSPNPYNLNLNLEPTITKIGRLSTF